MVFVRECDDRPMGLSSFAFETALQNQIWPLEIGKNQLEGFFLAAFWLSLDDESSPRYIFSRKSSGMSWSLSAALPNYILVNFGTRVNIIDIVGVHSSNIH